jgi:hypothetical protein
MQRTIGPCRESNKQPCIPVQRSNQLSYIQSPVVSEALRPQVNAYYIRVLPC